MLLVRPRPRGIGRDAPPRDGAVRPARPYAELDRLMDRYADGDRSAFPELHRQLSPRLYMFLSRLCGRSFVADDLLQETFLRIHRARGTFERGGAALAWSYAIARNAYIDHTRARSNRNSELLGDLPESNHPPAPPAGSPDATLVAKQTFGIIEATLTALPVAHREAFILLRFEGLSVAEAAHVLDTSEANVKVRAFRAYEAIRSALKQRSEP